jgi:hypothetical protein
MPWAATGYFSVAVRDGRTASEDTPQNTYRVRCRITTASGVRAGAEALDLAVSMKTAKALRLGIPPEIMVRATRLIE